MAYKKVPRFTWEVVETAIGKKRDWSLSPHEKQLLEEHFKLRMSFKEMKTLHSPDGEWTLRGEVHRALRVLCLVGPPMPPWMSHEEYRHGVLLRRATAAARRHGDFGPGVYAYVAGGTFVLLHVAHQMGNATVASENIVVFRKPGAKQLIYYRPAREWNAQVEWGDGVVRPRYCWLGNPLLGPSGIHIQNKQELV